MSVVITGITGFIGRRLARRLLADGYSVSGLARNVSNRHRSDFPDLDIHFGDIRDRDGLRHIFRKIKPETVVHLAAQSSVEYSFLHEREAYDTNFMGVVNVASESLDANPHLEKFVFSSSVEVYGNQSMPVIHEDAEARPASPYGVAKLAAEHYIQYLCRGYGFPGLIFRSANTYGRRDNHYFVIEHIIWNMLYGEGGIQMGNPWPIRDFLHIDDELDAYMRAIETESDVFGVPMNTGTGRGVTINDLYGLIREMMGSDAEPLWQTHSPRPYEIDSLVLDASRIKEALGWEPLISLEDGLERTIEWWRTNG